MGGIFGGSGGGSSTTVVNVPGPTAEETELTKQQIELQKQQIEILKEQRQEQGLAFEFLQTSLDELNQRQKDFDEDPVLQEITDLQLDLLRRGGKASPEERQLINEATEAALKRGSSDIATFAQEAAQQIKDITAPSRGLRASDTPIANAIGQVGKEATRQFGQLETGLRGVQAQAELDFPLARGQFLAETSNFAANLAAASRDFQQQLQQQAFANQLALSGLRQEGALGLLGVQPSGASALAALSGIRAAQTTTTTNSSFSKRPSIFEGLSSIGQFGFGLGTLIKASSRAFKDPRGSVEPEAALAVVQALPLEAWVYKVDPETPHVGPYAEDFQRLTGLGDGRTVDYADLVGLLVGAVKALAARQEARHA